MPTISRAAFSDCERGRKRGNAAVQQSFEQSVVQQSVEQSVVQHDDPVAGQHANAELMLKSMVAASRPFNICFIFKNSFKASKKIVY